MYSHHHSSFTDFQTDAWICLSPKNVSQKKSSSVYWALPSLNAPLRRDLRWALCSDSLTNALKFIKKPGESWLRRRVRCWHIIGFLAVRSSTEWWGILTWKCTSVCVCHCLCEMSSQMYVTSLCMKWLSLVMTGHTCGTASGVPEVLCLSWVVIPLSWLDMSRVTGSTLGMGGEGGVVWRTIGPEIRQKVSSGPPPSA